MQLPPHVALYSDSGGSHPSGFAWAASVVWHGGVVSDGYHLKASHRQAFDRRLHNRDKYKVNGNTELTELMGTDQDVCGS